MANNSIKLFESYSNKKSYFSSFINGSPSEAGGPICLILLLEAVKIRTKSVQRYGNIKSKLGGIPKG